MTCRHCHLSEVDHHAYDPVTLSEDAGWFGLRPDAVQGMDEVFAGWAGGTVHMEALGDATYWFGVTFPNGERLVWTVYRKGKRLMVNVTERPRGVEERK